MTPNTPPILQKTRNLSLLTPSEDVVNNETIYAEEHLSHEVIQEEDHNSVYSNLDLLKYKELNPTDQDNFEDILEVTPDTTVNRVSVSNKQFRDTIKPSDDCYEAAIKRTIQSYEYISDETGIKEILNLGKPVIIGMYVFQDFMIADKEKYIIPMPAIKERSLGGHAVSIVGYTEDNQFIIKNSFGPSWGDNGYALLPLEYMEKYVFDRWHITLKENGGVDDTANTAYQLHHLSEACSRLIALLK